MRKMFSFEMKRLLLPVLVYSIIVMISSIVYFSFAFPLTWYNFINFFSLYLFGLVFCLVFFSFSYNKKRVSADMTYSLPVTKRQLFAGKYLANITMMLISSLIIFIFLLSILGILHNKINTYDIAYHMKYMTLGCLLIAGMSFPLYSFLLLFYYKANTIFDGVIFIALGTLILSLLVLFILKIFNLEGTSFVLGAIFDFPYLILEKNLLFPKILYGIYIVLGFCSIGYLLWFVKRDSSIRTHEICNGYFGYKIFLPLSAATIVLNCLEFPSAEIIAVGTILIGIGLFCGYALYHRSMKFSKTSYIVYIATIGVCFLSFIISFIISI